VFIDNIVCNSTNFSFLYHSSLSVSCHNLHLVQCTLLTMLLWYCQGLSAGLVFLGVWILTMYAHYEQLSDVLNFSLLPAYILLAVGIVLFALGTIGCVGAVRDHKCLYGLVSFFGSLWLMKYQNLLTRWVKFWCLVIAAVICGDSIWFSVFTF